MGRRGWTRLNIFIGHLAALLQFAAADVVPIVIHQLDGSLKFLLPLSVIPEIQHHSCDAQWDVDNKTVAIMNKDGVTSQAPVKEVTNTSVTIESCSEGETVRYFIDCLETKYREEIFYKCTTGSSEPSVMTPARNHYAAIFVASLFCTICLCIIIILLVSYYRNQKETGRGQ